MKTLKVTFLLVAIAFAGGCSAEYDIAIVNGRVMDPETNFDEVRNVGVKDGLIVEITEDEITATTIIDATGHIVSPGFIDTHFHHTRPLGYKLALRDGVTTAMDLEAGVYGPRINDWYEMHRDRSLVNYGTSSGHEFARSKVTQNLSDDYLLDAPWSVVKSRGAGNDWATMVLDEDSGNEMLRIIDEGLRQGGLGIASTVGYFPGATAREMYEVQKVGARYGRPTAVHLRYTPGTVTTEANGAQEILANAVALNSPAIINHFNNPGWQLVQELLVKHREQGYNVWGEIYPYAAGSTTINAAFIQPEVWVDQLGNRYEDTLQDPISEEFYTQQRYEEVLAAAPATQVILYKMDPKDIPDWCRLPGVVIASDAMMFAGGWDDSPTVDTPYEEIPNTHPRFAGTHGTCLRLAREYDIPLMQIISASSYNPAKYLGDTGLESMKMRGRLQTGMVADITIIDPDLVSDTATYSNGASPTVGIPYVIVNGKLVVDNSEVNTEILAGQAIRFPIEKQGRFEPVSEDAWKAQFLSTPRAFHGLDPDHVH